MFEPHKPPQQFKVYTLLKNLTLLKMLSKIKHDEEARFENLLFTIC